MRYSMDLRNGLFIGILLFVQLFCVIRCTMELEELKRFAHPPELHRKDMVYIQSDSTEIAHHLKQIESQPVENLHISVSHSEHSQVDINGIDHFSALTELWIVKDADNAIERLSLRYRNATHKNLPIERFHLCALYNVDDGDLVRLVDHMPMLKLLDFSGLKNSRPLKNLLLALENKPLIVLKLNYVEALSIDSSFFKFELNPMTFFKGFNNSSLMCLELCGNWIMSVHPGLSKALPRLRMINISNNDIIANDNNVFVLDFGLHPTIEVINISIQGVNRRERSVRENTEIPKHYTKKNVFVNKEKHCYPEYKEVLFRKDWLSLCNAWNCVGKSHIPCSLFSVNISVDSLIDFSCDPPIKFPIGKNLKELYIDEMNWMPTQYHPYKDTLMQICFSDNSMRRLSFSNNRGESQLRGLSKRITHVTLLGLENLSHLDLSYNGLNIIPTEQMLFANFPNIRQLQLQGNNLSLIDTDNKTTHFCEMFKYLQVIDFSFGNIQDIPDNYFRHCDSVSEIILENNLLNGSHIMSLLNGLLNVKKINLRNNKIRMLPKLVRDKLKQLSNRDLEMNLGGNPLTCDCSEDSIETVKLLQHETSSVTFRSKDLYQCYQTYYSAGYQLILNINTKDIEHLCNRSKLSQILAATTTVAIVIATLLSFALLWRYRFFLFTRYYKMKLKIRNMDIYTFTYDIFISYCKEDRIWVHNVLMKRLQETYGFKLCIHLRDFRVGEDIDDEIVKHMSQSKAHIVILSKDYVRKQWPTFELKRAYTEHVQQGKEMIVIKYGILPSEDLPGLVQQILDAQIYLEWHEPQTAFPTQAEKMREELFWGRLVSKLYGRKYPCYLKTMCCCKSKRGSNIEYLLDDDTPLLP